MLFDTHLHLTDEDTPSSVFSEARANGVGGFVLAATDPADSAQYARIAAGEEGVFFTVGVHPHAAEGVGPDTGWTVDLLEASPYPVAIGEIGLDYYYNHSPKQAQRAVFEAFLGLACEHSLPVVVHCRDAYEDCFAILRNFGETLPRFVFHSYTGPVDYAREGLSMGALFSFNGIATFPKADNVREVLRQIPADRILLETDSPYLAPMPHRGKRNRPAWVADVARHLAQETNMTPEELAHRTTQNALDFFQLDKADLASAPDADTV
ncbi:MAG: TatD family hydrolase [Verrucomicrobiota bacterium]